MATRFCLPRRIGHPHGRRAEREQPALSPLAELHVGRGIWRGQLGIPRHGRRVRRRVRAVGVCAGATRWSPAAIGAAHGRPGTASRRGAPRRVHGRMAAVRDDAAAVRDSRPRPARDCAGWPGRDRHRHGVALSQGDLEESAERPAKRPGAAARRHEARVHPVPRRVHRRRPPPGAPLRLEDDGGRHQRTEGASSTGGTTSSTTGRRRTTSSRSGSGSSSTSSSPRTSARARCRS